MNRATWAFCRSRIALAGLVVAVAVAGCSVTQRAQVTDLNYCPFLGNKVCAKLTPTNSDSLIDLRYINPGAQWTQYNKVLIEPVSFWGSDDTTVSAADQRQLTNYFYQKLEQELGKKFQVVNEPGRGVMAIHVALEDASGATPVLRTVSVLEPHARAVATLTYLTTGTFPFIGSAQAEVKITDSVTGQVLAAGVDKRVGGGALTTGLQWQWGDAENAITQWSQTAATRLSSWTSGTAPS